MISFKYIIKPILIIAILIGYYSGISDAQESKESKESYLLTEQDNCLRFFLRINYNDKGLKSVADALIQSFVQNKIVNDRGLQISNISLPVFDKIYGNIYVSDTGKTKYFIVGHILADNPNISIKIGGVAVSLKIGDKESGKMLRKSILSELLRKYIGKTGSELSAYTFIEDSVIVGSTLNLVEYAKRNFSNLNSQTALDDKTDGYVTLENKGKLLLRLLNKYSGSLGFSLATSPDLNKIKNLKIKFDIIDQERAKLSFDLISSALTPHAQNTLQNDIKFVLELLRRICVQKNINFSYNIKDNFNIDIELSDLGKYWNNLK